MTIDLVIDLGRGEDAGAEAGVVGGVGLGSGLVRDRDEVGSGKEDESRWSDATWVAVEGERAERRLV